ncbi:MAG: tetratricopeptide repeat protein [Gammaproteobacteria bacterium]
MRILNHITALVLAFGVASCASFKVDTRDGEKLADPDKSLKIRKSQDSEYSQQSDLIYEVLVGELSGQFGDVGQALEHYINAANISDDPAVAERATRIAMFAKDWPAGIRAATRWSELVGDNLEISQILGVLELRSGNVDAAVPHFEKIMLAAEDSPAKGFSIIGAVLVRETESDAAIQLLEKLVNKHFENPYGHLTLASLAFQAQDFQRTIDESELALGFKPDLVEARAMRAQALMNLEETDQALQEMKFIVEESPGNREMRMAYARMLLTAERYDEAATEFDLLLAENPNDVDLIYTLGLLRLQQENYAEAEVQFKRLVERNQRKDEGHYYLGRVAEEQGNHQQAIAEFQKVEQGQYYIDANARIATIYKDIDGIGKAQHYLKNLRADLSTPENIIEVYLIEGQLLHDDKLYVAAMDLYSEGLQEFPGHSDLLYARALMAEEIDRIDLLETDLKAILSEDPDNASALNALGYTLADHNSRIDEALGYIKRALEIRPDDPAVIDSMGWVQFRMGNYLEAENYLRKAYGLLEDAEIAGHLVELLLAQGNNDEAQKIIKEGLEREPEDEYLLELQQKLQQ